MINFDRTKAQAPTIKRSYKTKQIYDALGIVFYNKCYLCETKYLSSRKPNIEHFKAHKGDEDLKYQWKNLYLACGDCNQYKRDLEILDPCNPDEDVETLILYELVPFGYIPTFTPSHPANSKIVATCNLLDKIHNGHDEHSELKTRDLRNAIRKRAAELIDTTLNYYKAAENEEAKKYKALQKIKKMCGRRSPYTMLMRAVVLRVMKEKDLQGLFD